MQTLAALFPGQGSHEEGMDAQLRDAPLMRRGLELLDFDPFARLAEGTRFQQPALFLVSAVAWEQADLEPLAAAGHSLGEYAALHAAGVLGFDDAVRLVAVRGEAMARAGEDRPGGMVAVLGEDEREVRAVAAEHGLIVANDNAPGQLVLSGSLEGLAAVEAHGFRRARRLDVSGAFHSPLMEPAAAALRAALAGVELAEPRFPVLSNGTAEPFGDVRAELVENLLRPVRWRETLLALHAMGATEFEEIGPGRVLSGLVKRTLREAA